MKIYYFKNNIFSKIYRLEWVLGLTSADNLLQMLNIMYTRKKWKCKKWCNDIIQNYL